MGEYLTDRAPPVSRQLPAPLRAALVGLTIWFVVAAWGFAGDGYDDFLLAVVSGFFLVVLLILYALWRVWNKQDPEAPRESGSLREWMSTEFDTWQDRLKGADAAVAILLPFAAAALGMTGFAIILHAVAHGAM